MKEALMKIAHQFVGIHYSDLTVLEKHILTLSTEALGWEAVEKQNGEIKLRRFKMGF